jgi:hypothetical protein
MRKPEPKILTVGDCAERAARGILGELGRADPTSEEVEQIAGPMVIEFDELRDAIERAAVRERADLLWARAEELFVVLDLWERAKTDLFVSLAADGEGDPDALEDEKRPGWFGRLRRRFRKEPVEEAKKPEPFDERLARELVAIASSWRESVGAPLHPVDD